LNRQRGSPGRKGLRTKRSFGLIHLASAEEKLEAKTKQGGREGNSEEAEDAAQRNSPSLQERTEETGQEGDAEVRQGVAKHRKEGAEVEKRKVGKQQRLRNCFHERKGQRTVMTTGDTKICGKRGRRSVSWKRPIWSKKLDRCTGDKTAGKGRRTSDGIPWGKGKKGSLIKMRKKVQSEGRGS